MPYKMVDMTPRQPKLLREQIHGSKTEDQKKCFFSWETNRTLMKVIRGSNGRFSSFWRLLFIKALYDFSRDVLPNGLVGAISSWGLPNGLKEAAWSHFLGEKKEAGVASPKQLRLLLWKSPSKQCLKQKWLSKFYPNYHYGKSRLVWHAAQNDGHCSSKKHTAFEFRMNSSLFSVWWIVHS
jgi:hypothetical protein